MKIFKKKAAIIVSAIALTGGLLFVPVTKANENIILASVEWVNSQINPLKSEVNALKQQVSQQQQEINTLKQQIGQGGSTPPPATTPATVYVTKNNTAFRTGASTAYKVVAYKNAGTSFKIVGQHSGSTGLWYRVELTSSTLAWVNSADISTTKPSGTAPKEVFAFGEVNLRSGATTAYRVIETIPRGTTMAYLSSFTNAAGETWHRVKAPSGNEGWVIGGLVEVR
ncbi:SH3 domain-containing protein [Jeotgalibacillus sp. R-1-5s-1]|uniref:SH3 domain-containing protein n=1 Tax=Jeotgalibacillus sp. R-1-5s-1 TaxID=2555897 RepID=UPI00141B2295|nr:SH3 domain-containing protein [Jeotgalibacillus sp. R-1-5s-1]